MDKQKVTSFFKSIKALATKHSPEILTAIGIAGMIGTTIMAVSATPKALRLIEKAEKEEDRRLTKVEVVKVTWKKYLPATVTGAVSIGCLIGANSVHAKRNAALATAYQLSTTAFNEYREKVVETIGEKKEKAVHDKVAADRIEKNPVSQNQVIITGNGTSLCYDVAGDRYFESSIDRIKRAVNDLNYRMISGAEMSISLNEFYTAIGLKQTPLGEQVGWRIDKGQIDIHFSSQIADDDRPCIVIEYLVPPEYGFNDLY